MGSLGLFLSVPLAPTTSSSANPVSISLYAPAPALSEGGTDERFLAILGGLPLRFMLGASDAIREDMITAVDKRLTKVIEPSDEGQKMVGL